MDVLVTAGATPGASTATAVVVVASGAEVVVEVSAPGGAGTAEVGDVLGVAVVVGAVVVVVGALVVEDEVVDGDVEVVVSGSAPSPAVVEGSAWAHSPTGAAHWSAAVTSWRPA